MMMCCKQEDSPDFPGKVEDLKKELSLWESYLSEGKYLVGNQITLADLGLGPWIFFFQRQGATFKDFPKLAAYAATLKVGTGYMRF